VKTCPALSPGHAGPSKASSHPTLSLQKPAPPCIHVCHRSVPLPRFSASPSSPPKAAHAYLDLSSVSLPLYKEISASSLQNPADDTATSVSLYPNVVSDEVIAAERVTEIKERMDVKEMITDAGFTDIVACPVGQSPTREIHNEEKERWAVRFSREWCGSCPMIGQCPVAERQKFYSLSFTDRQSVVARRRQALDQEDYREKRRLRPAVEGTVSQFKQRTRNEKLRVRGYRRVRNAIIAMAIAINLGRILAYLEQKKRYMTHSLIPITALFVALAVISTGKWLRKRLMAQTMSQEAIC